MPSRAALNPPDTSTSSSGGVHPSTTPIPVPTALLSPSQYSRIAENSRIADIPAAFPPHSPQHHRGHTRSISHPLTSPFSGIGKIRDKSILKHASVDTDDDDDDDGDEIYLPDPFSSSPRKGQPRTYPREDLTIGKCMTCNATVRWPRNLKVFRCTECLTVNDLEPCQETRDSGNQGNLGKNAKPPRPAIPRKAISLSVERTKKIIDGCITTYLRQRLEAPAAQVLPPGNRPNANSGGGKDENSSQSPQKFPYSTEPQRPMVIHSRSASSSDRPGKPSGVDGSSGGSRYLFPPIPPPKDVVGSPNTSRSGQPRKPGRLHDVEGRDKEKHPYIFRELEEYILSAFKGCDTLNVSFVTAQLPPRNIMDSSSPKQDAEQNSGLTHSHPIIEPDPKILLLGDLAENSSWWMVDTEEAIECNYGQSKHKTSNSSRTVTSRSPRIDWRELDQWYHLIMTAGASWIEQWSSMRPSQFPGRDVYTRAKAWDTADLSAIEKEVTDSRIHLHRTLLKATENLLKRPRRPLKKPDDIRFLLILLSNPLIYPQSSALVGPAIGPNYRKPPRLMEGNHRPANDSRGLPSRNVSGGTGHHHGLVKRILGLLAHLPNECHHYLVSWFSRFSVGQFEKTAELVGRFVTYRLSRQHERRRSESANEDNSLIPSFSSAAMTTPAELHAAISGRNRNKQAKDRREVQVVYGDDWQVRAAARVMALLFTANNTNHARKTDAGLDQESVLSPRQQANRRGQMIPTSAFYNTLLDYSDLVADFEAWESRSAKFSFCQYPFFLSIWAKIRIMEYDTRRQMEVKAREAFFNSILSQKAENQWLMLKVRRDCLVEDSLRGVSEVIGSSHEEIKKGLRIQFVGEEGIDAGGLRKEWFLLLVREVFDPHHGLFIYDEDSRYCYFNPYCFESSEQFFLVGVVLGLAIYNSIILDVALPPFAFKKLLAAAPHTSGPQPSTARPPYKCSLDDLAELRPTLAKGLRALLEFDGDVEETFCRNFAADVDRYGEVVTVPLCPGGEKKPVTNANRREFVNLYVQYQLDTAVTRQFEPFRRGFFTVCGGNALSLFRPEEIELLVRGSDEPLNVRSLRAVATYDNWSTPKPETVPVVQWFWDFFERTVTEAQRKILSFITGSDRIPAMGATSLTIRVVCLGGDSPRFPIARTCFNQLGLYRYATREKLERLLWEAVLNSEGFGLK